MPTAPAKPGAARGAEPEPKHEAKRSDATRTALLCAAREEFAERGLAGARVDRIAEAAGVNKERIYGIFGSKDKLFDAVLIDALKEFTDMVDPLWNDGRVGPFVLRLYDYHREHPQLLRLLTWEGLHRGEDAHDIDGWRRAHYDRKLDAAMDRFATDDAFRAGLITLLICGIPNWLNLVPQLRSLMLGDRMNDVDAIKALLVPFAENAANAFTPETAPAPPEDPEDEVAAAAEHLRRAQAEADAARDELGAALRRANAAGASANHLAKQVAGTVSRPVVLRLLNE
ncbi:TetR/AcrR family transcriptional regulator [Glycomyces artemisiae]|uniref:TetR family transcriptional regulator n=1 Tax=Glycomyces artemisiae TaxID=1076443 RepID=A0A2T0USA9_9ACTN|nr:TetR family transcriptional regulator [Glycomyces artemisiae]PRY60796.1 TetR family transcriptional regulator [Glycomyces artemisiae]